MHHSDSGTSEHFVNPLGTLRLLDIKLPNRVRALLVALNGFWNVHGFSGRGVVDVVGQEFREDKWISLFEQNVVLQPWSVFSGSISSLVEFLFATNHDASHSVLGIWVRNVPSEKIINIEVLDQILHLIEQFITQGGVISRRLPLLVRILDAVALLVVSQHFWRDQLHVGEGLWKRWGRIEVPVGATIADQEACEIVSLEGGVPLGLQVVFVDLPR